MTIAAALLIALVAQVLTTQYDNARTGATLRETTLTPANVNAVRFGKLFSFAVDGDVYTQPLYMPGVEIPDKGVHDVVFVATEHDSVYAFDAGGQPTTPLWHVSFLEAGGSGTVPSGDVRCPFIQPEIGITPTPAIDPQSGTLYVLARTRESAGLLRSRYVQRLHALAITTGVEKFGGPVEIQAFVHGSGEGGSGGAIPFDPLRELPRAGLLLSGGQVYLTWASSCDVGPYHGWVMAYDAKSLKQTAVFNTSPDAAQSGIWQGDNGPAADRDGNIYVVTGNGAFSAANGGRDYGDSVMKIALANNQLVVRDYFTPANQKLLDAKDLDLGSSGPVLLPDQPGEHPHLLLAGGKDASLFLLDRDSLGKHAPQGEGHPVQVLSMKGGVYAPATYWNGHVYVLASSDYLSDFALSRGQLSAAPVARGTQKFTNPGAPLAVSADGSRNAIVWAIETKVWNAWATEKAAVLHAFDATNVARELYTSEQNAGRDRAGPAVRFTIPTVAKGRVYVPAKREVDVYGLLK
jgi:hypothetical protein